MTPQPIQTRGEGSQHGTHIGGATRVVVVVDGHSGVFERGWPITYSASRWDKVPARWVSLERLPLSRAITRPRRRASRARSGSVSRKANP